MTQRLQPDQLRSLAAGAGFTGINVDVAVAVAMAESGGVPDVVSRTQDYGLWQINKAAHGSQYDFARLLTDYAYNASAAYAISGGTNFNPWTTYTSNKFKQYLPASLQGGVLVSTSPTSSTPYNFSSGNLYGSVGTRAAVQQAHDPRMQRVGTGAQTMFSAAASKGKIVSDMPKTLGVEVKFLYNPASITFNYSVDPSALPADQQDPSQSLIGLAINTTTVIQFQLFFDRTYECLGGSSVGVLTDINALEGMCGISPDAPFMMLNKVKFIFGYSQQFVYSGAIQTFTVEYTHFNTGMVPMRCVVDLTARRLGPGTNVLDPTQWLNATKWNADGTPIGSAAIASPSSASSPATTIVSPGPTLGRNDVAPASFFPQPAPNLPGSGSPLGRNDTAPPSFFP